MTQRPIAAAILAVSLGAALSTAPSAARAGILDSLFGSEGATKQVDARRRVWMVHEYTQVRIVAREAGSAPNQHPWSVDRESLRLTLGQVRVDTPAGPQALFATDELAELTEPLSEALGVAGPDDDVVLLSSARRGAGLFSQPLAITARLFAKDGALQLIVNEARQEYFNEMRGTNRAPNFSFGSRAKPGVAVLRTGIGASPRPDWVSLPPAAGATVLPATASPAPAAAPKPAAPAAMPAAPVAPAAAAAPAPRAAASADEVEQRLTTLKRLRDKNLITEEEYQQKRREILSQL